jgi:hypothetical protein
MTRVTFCDETGRQRSHGWLNWDAVAAIMYEGDNYKVYYRDEDFAFLTKGCVDKLVERGILEDGVHRS